MLGERVLDFVEAARAADTLEALEQVFRREADRLGFDTFACGAAPLHTGGDLEDRLYLVTWPEAWLEHYKERNFARVDVLPRYARRRLTPFTWREAIDACLPTMPESLEPIAEAAAQGWTAGFVVPIHGPGGYTALVSLAGRNDDLSPRERTALHLISLAAHERARELWEAAHGPMHPAVPPLSLRELEVLKWVVAGKSDWEIGRILSIAASTAHTHVERAKKKLGASTRAQAAALAVWYGLVQP